jgi:CubicO group peptidase (beta-lactamase class C family)
VTKVPTAAAALKLLAQLGVSLDASVFATIRDRLGTCHTLLEYLADGGDYNPVLRAAVFGDPAFAAQCFVENALDANNEKVTFRQLLTHRSGYRQCGTCSPKDLVAQFIKGPRELVRNSEGDPTCEHGPPIEPGTTPAYYSNLNYCMLELALEALLDLEAFEARVRLTGHDGFQRFARHSVFLPAGAVTTFCLSDSLNRPDSALIYAPGDEVAERPGYAFPNGVGDYNDLGICGPGNYVSSVSELLSFLIWLEDEEPVLASQMQSGCVAEGGNPHVDFCLGFHTFSDPAGDVWFHTGGIGANGQGMNSGIMLFPFDVKAAVVMNSSNTEVATEIVRECFNDAVARPDPVAEITAPLDGAAISLDQPVEAMGTGFDPEDGFLTGDSLTWFSSVAGQLRDQMGNPLVGESIAFQHVAGPQVITLRATDSDGNVAEDSITIFGFTEPN